MQWHLLADTCQDPGQPVSMTPLVLGLSRYQPSAATGDDAYSHRGEEAGLVLAGVSELTICANEYALHADDSFSFASHLAMPNPPPKTKPSQRGRTPRFLADRNKTMTLRG